MIWETEKDIWELEMEAEDRKQLETAVYYMNTRKKQKFLALIHGPAT